MSPIHRNPEEGAGSSWRGGDQSWGAAETNRVASNSLMMDRIGDGEERRGEDRIAQHSTAQHTAQGTIIVKALSGPGPESTQSEVIIVNVIATTGRGSQGCYWSKGRVTASQDHQVWSRPLPVDDQLQQYSMGQLCEFRVTWHMVIVL